MGDDYALGLGRRARREDDLGHVVGLERGPGRGAPVAPVELRQAPHLYVVSHAAPAASCRRGHVVADQRDARTNDAAHPPRELEGGAEVDGDHDHAREDAPPERGNPLGPVLGPEQGRVALAESRLAQASCETAGGGRHVAVSIASGPEPVVVDQELAGLRRKVLEEVGERLARHG